MTRRRRKHRLTRAEQTQLLIDQLCECICEDNCVRAVMHMGHSYEIHEIPWDDVYWYIGFDPHGTIVALTTDFKEAVEQAEKLLETAAEYENPAEWKEYQLATIPQKDYLYN